jgi:hypothetical protein
VEVEVEERMGVNSADVSNRREGGGRGVESLSRVRKDAGM